MAEKYNLPGKAITNVREFLYRAETEQLSNVRFVVCD
jgi:hypothetical protein